MPSIDILLEAERRGILPADKKELLAEARRRGLAPNPVVSQTGDSAAIGFDPSLTPEERNFANRVLQGGTQNTTLPSPPSYLSQAVSGLTQPFRTTAREFSAGLAEFGHVPQAGDSYLGGIARRGLGALRAANAPITGFLYEPLKELKLGELMLPPFARESAPQPVKDVLNETVALGGTIAGAPVLTQLPRAVVQSATRGIASRLARKETLQGVVEEQAGKRAEDIARARTELGDVQGAASRLGQTADDLARTEELAQTQLAQAKALPVPPSLPRVDPVTVQATQQLARFPLRVDPTNIPALDEGITTAGSKFIGNSGLFRQAARKIKNSFTDRINAIFPEGATIKDVTPIQDAAQSILPKTQTAELLTPAQKIATGIDDILADSKLSYVDKAELAAQRINALPSAYSGPQARGINLKDLVKSPLFTGGTPGGVAKELTQGGSTVAGPLLRDVHGERVVIRAMKRAAEKNGHSLLRNQLQTLENGYTKAINDSLGPDASKALAQWDKDYSYASKNLFGFESLPYKLSTQKAEDFATQLFKKSGKAQEETALKTMELLGPEQRNELGQTFLQVIGKRSQSPELAFDPVKWGKEYFSYKDSIKQSVLSPEHKKDLDEIARMFVRAPARQQAQAAARLAQVEARRTGIRESQAALGTATQNLKSIEDQIAALRTEGKGLEGQIQSFGKPTEIEKLSEKEIRELNAPGAMQRFLRMAKLHAEWRLAWGLGAIFVGKEYGSSLTAASGALLAGTGALEMLLKSSVGTKIVKALAKETPGSANAVRLSIAAQRLFGQISEPPPNPPTASQ